MSEKIYRKVGRRYQPVGIEWVGWPCNGVWFVGEARQSLIMRLGDLPDPMPLAALETYRDAACRAVMRMMDRWHQQPLSANDFVDEIFKEIAKERQP